MATIKGSTQQEMWDGVMLSLTWLISEGIHLDEIILVHHDAPIPSKMIQEHAPTGRSTLTIEYTDLKIQEVFHKKISHAGNTNPTITNF